MTFLVYRKSTDSVVNWHETEAEITQPGDDIDILVFEQDYDPSEVFSLSLTLSEDGNSLVNKYPGLTISEQIERVNAAKSEKEIIRLKEVQTEKIDFAIAERLKVSEWKLTRASDIDLVNGNTDAMDALKAERESMRSAAKAHKAALNSLTSLEDVSNFNINAF